MGLVEQRPELIQQLRALFAQQSDKAERSSQASERVVLLIVHVFGMGYQVLGDVARTGGVGSSALHGRLGVGMDAEGMEAG